MRTIAFANNKGGTGKTSLSVHTAVGLARRGKRVLLVDLDFQANATRWLLAHGEPAEGSPGIAGALTSGRMTDEHIHPSRCEGLDVCPSTRELPSAEVEMAQQVAGQKNLRRALAMVQRRYDFCIIDCAPSLGTGTVAGLCAADSVFVPIPPAFLSIVGVGGLEATVTRIRDGFDVDTTVAGYVLFAVDSREGLAVATRELLQSETKGKLLRAEVRLSTAGKKLPELQATAWDAGMDARGAQDYRALLTELVKRTER